jgi:hypothetical protein
MCPKCGATITPDLVKRVDFERIECPRRGETFQPGAKERESIFPVPRLKRLVVSERVLGGLFGLFGAPRSGYEGYN